MRAVITTTGLYWSMIESGLGLISACLPTVYALFKKKSKSSALYDGNKPRSNSVGSDSHMVMGTTGAASIDAYALKELNPAFDRNEHQNGKIFVNNSFHMTEDVV